MIENKKILITENTSFDNGWSLITPFAIPLLRNNRFRPLNVSDVVRAITYADTVNLILSEPCLSGAIVKELSWANRYVTINVIAKGKSVLDRYAQLHFASEKIDKDIGFNYIAIEGKETVFAFISDYYIATDERVNAVYFQSEPAKSGLDLPENVESVILTNEYNNKDYTEVIALCKKRNIPFTYLVGANAYTEEAVKKFKTDGLTLLCAQRVNDGILYKTADGALFCVNAVGSESVSVEVRSFEYYFDTPYKGLGMPDTVAVKDIPADSYTCVNGEIKRLHFQKIKVIERTVQTDSMGDFLDEKFDRSETESYNRYRTEVETVTYAFTLIPPIFHTDKYSDIYDCAESVYGQWCDVMSYPLNDVIAALGEIELQDSSICATCKKIVDFDEAIKIIIKSHRYKNFYDRVKDIYNEISNTLDKFLPYCEELFSAVNSEKSESKLDKIDAEIEGYRRTIEEKKLLVAQGTDVLSNKRRIEILEKKIADLSTLKQAFAGVATARDNRQTEEFTAFCKSVLGGTYKEEIQNPDPIGNVIAIKQNVRLKKLKAFIKSNLREFHEFSGKAKTVAEKFANIDIPTEYVVYEQDGQRVIAIESEQEYYGTKAMQKKYKLQCRARR